MKRHLFLLSSLLSIGALSGGVAAAPTAALTMTIKAPQLASFPVILNRLARIGTGGDRFKAGRWPYGGKNRAQRQRLNVGFWG